VLLSLQMSLSRPQKKVLSTLRSLLRHVNDHVDNRTAAGTSDTRVWRSYIMEQYRANKSVKGREEVSRLRSVATDSLACLQAVVEQRVRTCRSRAVAAAASRSGVVSRCAAGLVL
jgi:hypothetical protein